MGESRRSGSGQALRGNDAGALWDGYAAKPPSINKLAPVTMPDSGPAR